MQFNTSTSYLFLLDLPSLPHTSKLICFCMIHVFFFSFRPQTNQSFEAQEVSSPTKNPIQPQWRQKVKREEIFLDLLIFLMLISNISTVCCLFFWLCSWQELRMSFSRAKSRKSTHIRRETSRKMDVCQREASLLYFGLLSLFTPTASDSVFHLLGFESPESDRNDAPLDRKHSTEAPTCTYEGQSSRSSCQKTLF